MMQRAPYKAMPCSAYAITEIFDSIQGEGAWTGFPVSFVRFAGCNLRCVFCDTDFKANFSLSPTEILEQTNCSRIVLTGGEPLLQDLGALLALCGEKRLIGVETNGTLKMLHKFNHVSLSPKVPRKKLALDACDSLKVLFPYMQGVEANDFQSFPAKYRCLQPVEVNGYMPIKEAIQEVKRLGNDWRLGVQLHKLIKER